MDPAALVSTLLALHDGKKVPLEHIEEVGEQLCNLVTDPEHDRISIRVGEVTIYCNATPPPRPPG